MPRQASASTSATATSPAPLRYEDALAELERLVQRMEDGQLPLDQLLDACRSRLSAIEQQVKVLEDGQLKPWVNGTAGA